MKYNKLDLHQPNNKYPFYRQQISGGKNTTTFGYSTRKI